MDMDDGPKCSATGCAKLAEWRIYSAPNRTGAAPTQYICVKHIDPLLKHLIHDQEHAFTHIERLDGLPDGWAP